MQDPATLETLLASIAETVVDIDLNRPDAATLLEAALPVSGPTLTRLRELVRAGIQAGTLANREAGGLRFSRLRKATGASDCSIDVVHMSQRGPGHTHPRGEADLCFAVSGTPTFDGRKEGWTVYPSGSWHEPTVSGGVMDILYFLPGGEIRFEAAPT